MVTYRPRLLVFALFALMGAVASVARADVDLTGTWTVEYDGNGILPDSTETATLVQSGTSLAFDDMTGTIDPATGVFHVEGAPTSGYMGMLGPPPKHEGTATPDGNHFAGTLTLYAQTVHFVWVGFDFPTRGTREGVSPVCGDLWVDVGETCDDGAFNGVNGCCDAACALVDPDADGICSPLDNCPDVANPDQTNVCGGVEPFAMERLRVYRERQPLKDDGKLVLKATLGLPAGATIANVLSFRLRDVNVYDYDVRDLLCVRPNDHTLRCRRPDKGGEVKNRDDEEGHEAAREAHPHGDRGGWRPALHRVVHGSTGTHADRVRPVLHVRPEARRLCAVS